MSDERSDPGTTSEFPLDDLFAIGESRELAPTIGRFSILEKIGHGGMGVVYLGYDARLDRRAAVKLLRYEGDSEAGRARLLREAQALARVSHPNVVPIYECGEHGDDAFIAMEYVAGHTLRDWIKSPRTTSEILAIFVAAGRGLEAAHGQGLTHRDFKPENVMVGKDGRARVMDFGLVRVLDDAESAKQTAAIEAAADDVDLTATGALLGTPAYMAPEQYRGGHIGPHTDQFSFCVALWEALYGARPFAGSKVGELATSILAGRITAPSPESKVPARIRKALERGMAIAPEKRWPSLGALLTVLEGELSVGRRRMVAAVSVALLAMLVGAAGFAWQKAAALRVAEAEQRVTAAERHAMRSSEALTKGHAVEALTLAIEAAATLADDSGAIPAKLPSQVNRSLHEASIAELSWGVTSTFPSGSAAVAFSPDGEWLALAKHERVFDFEYHFIEIHHVDDGAVAAKLLGHNCYPYDMQFFADGSRIFAHCGEDGSAHLWDSSGALLKSFESHEMATVSRAGSVVATRSANDVELIDASGASRATLRGHAGEPTAMLFSHDGARLAVVEPNAVRVWDAGSGEALATVDHAGVLGAAWFADGSGRLATVASDQHVRIWKGESGELINVLVPGNDASTNVTPEHFHGLAISPDGKRAVTYMFRHAWLWDTQSTVLIERIVDHSIHSLDDHHRILWGMNYELLDFSPDGSRLALHRHDGSLLLLDSESGAVVEESDGAVLSNSFSPDGKYLVVESQGTEIWDPASGARLESLEGTYYSQIAEFSPDGRLMATLGQDANDEWQTQLWDTAPRQSSTVEIVNSGSTAEVLSVASDDGRIVTAELDRPRPWQTSAESEPAGDHASGIRLAKFSHGGRFLASIDRAEVLRIWDTRTDTLTGGPFQLARVKALAVSDDGTYVALAQGESLDVRDARSNALVIELDLPVREAEALKFSPDGGLLAATYGPESIVWDVSTGEQVHEFRGYGDSFAFSPDGTRAVTGPWLVDLTTGAVINVLDHYPQDDGPTVFSPDGSLISVADKLWDGYTGAYLGELEGHQLKIRAQGFLAGGNRILTSSDDVIIARDTALPLEAACTRLQPYVLAYAKVADTCDSVLRQSQAEGPRVPTFISRSRADDRWIAETIAALVFLASMLAAGVSGRLEQACAKLPIARSMVRAAHALGLAGIASLGILVLISVRLSPPSWDRPNTIVLFWVLLLLPTLGLALRHSPNRWWMWVSLATVSSVAACLMVAPAFLANLHDVTPTGFATIEALVQPFVHTHPHEVHGGFAAHADAHRALAHGWQSFGLFAVLVTVGLYGTHRLGSLVAKRHGERLGFVSLDQRGALPLVFFMLVAYGLVSAPVLNAVARQQERSADVFALDRGGDARSCAANAVIQSRTAGLRDERPGLVSVIWHARQPALAERIEACAIDRG